MRFNWRALVLTLSPLALFIKFNAYSVFFVAAFSIYYVARLSLLRAEDLEQYLEEKKKSDLLISQLKDSNKQLVDRVSFLDKETIRHKKRMEFIEKKLHRPIVNVHKTKYQRLFSASEGKLPEVTMKNPHAPIEKPIVTRRNQNDARTQTKPVS